MTGEVPAAICCFACGALLTNKISGSGDSSILDYRSNVSRVTVEGGHKLFHR
jgi:hypothetical protein